MFDAATVEEARLRLAEEMDERQRAEQLQWRRRADEIELWRRANKLYKHRRIDELHEQLGMRELHQRQRQETLEQQLREEAAATKVVASTSATQVEEDNDDFDWSDNDGQDPEEAAAQQRALLELFESEDKLLDDTRAREEDNDARVRRGVELSLQHEQLRSVGDDAANEHRPLLATLRRERWRAA
jgi:hypothetical protein